MCCGIIYNTKIFRSNKLTPLKTNIVQTISSGKEKSSPSLQYAGNSK